MAVKLLSKHYPMRRVDERLSAVLVMLLCVVTTLLVRLWTTPGQFADNEVYVDIAGDLRTAQFADLFPLEPLSRGWLALLSASITNPVAAIDLASWINSGIFVLLLGFLALNRSVNWRGLVLVWGLYGALLAFVTLRATPAYLLVVWAVLTMQQAPRRAIALTVLASGFHISAVMVLPPMLLQLMLNRLPPAAYERWSMRIGGALIAAGCATYVALNLSGEVAANLMTSVFGIHEDFAKFFVYAEAIGSEQSLFHRAYFAGLVLLLLVALGLGGRDSRRSLPYACLSLVIMAMTSPSPVVAFRQSLFWAAPLLLTMPWKTIVPGPLSPFLFPLVAVALQAIGLMGTLIA